MIKISKLKLLFFKSERGTHTKLVTVKRGGKTFKRKQRVGRKVVEKVNLYHKGKNIIEDLSNKKFFHLTNDPNFKPNINYEQEVQEFGSGLYITEKSVAGLALTSAMYAETVLLLNLFSVIFFLSGNTLTSFPHILSWPLIAFLLPLII